MAYPAVRTKQTTSTTGTGTLTLNAASTDFRSFNAAFGAGSQRVRYILSRSGTWEVGYGTFNGGSPGTLTRVDVMASSNGGSLVNLPAGTTDVFFDFLPGDRAIRTVSTTATLALADIGNLIRCNQSADFTLSLPAVAGVPEGMGFLISNEGSNWSTVTIDPNGAEAIDGITSSFPLFANEALELFSIGTAWRTGVKPTGQRMVAHASASGSASLDFLLPFYVSAARSVFRLTFRQMRPASDGAELWLRTDFDAAASFDAGASDYLFARGYTSGAATWAGAAPAAATAIPLTTDIDITDTGNTAFGEVRISPGAAGVRRCHVNFDSSTGGNGAIYAGAQRLVGMGTRATAGDVNAVRLLMSTGNIGLGEASLFVTYN